MKTVKVEAENGSYDILIGAGLLASWKPEGNYCVITDENVMHHQGQAFPKERYASIQEPGESSKTMEQLERILNNMVELNLGRQDTLIAFGGGVVGDIGGFAASCYKRGIPYIQIPTTLLAQVDSSVGGKVAVDLKGGKNLAGAFYQPELVLIDTDTLKTLPQREIAAGMAEVVKYGFIADRAFHDQLLESELPFEKIVENCCRIKADYVTKDPMDHGIRAQLNYGHTIGHALETAAGYGDYLHGEAVSIGMVYAAALGEELGISPKGLRADTERLLKRYSLPTDTDHELLRKALQIIAHDKKTVGEVIDMIFVDHIGHAISTRLAVAEIANMMEQLI